MRSPRSCLQVLALLGAFSLSAPAQSPAPLVSKQVSAPADDIVSGLLRMPRPEDLALRSRAAIFPVEFEPGAEGGLFETEVSLERSGRLSLVAMADSLGDWRIELCAPGEGFRRLEALLRSKNGISRAGLALEKPVRRFDLYGGRAGTWKVRIFAKGERVRREGGLLVAAGESDLELVSHLTTNALLEDERIGIVASVGEPSETGFTRGASADVSIDSAVVILDSWEGKVWVSMADDGLHLDGDAGDGVYGAILPRQRASEATALVDFRGRTASGEPFHRSAQHGFSILSRRAVLSGRVTPRSIDETHLELSFEAWALGEPSKLQISCEVWGTNDAGESVPICWLSRMVEPRIVDTGWELPLTLDLRWLDVERASAPLELRNIRLQDPDTHVPFDVLDEIELDSRALPQPPGSGLREPTREMLTGVAGATIGGAFSPGSSRTRDPAPVPRALMLVHGWCSGGSVWPAAHFSQPKIEFLDPNQNRSNDQFAQMLGQFGANQSSFSVVGHSQGGMAALHLMTYYVSGLDRGDDGRRIQSVGTPYQGTPLASLGDFSCGVNNDLTPAGAATWLAGIPSWARSEVFYWTTSNSGSACNFFTDLFLTDPNDGVVEQARGQLPGGVNMGHVTGWCHTTGMTNPAQYTDATRNVQLNAEAAR